MVGSNSFFSSSQSTLSPFPSPNSSFSIFQRTDIANRFQYDYIKESLLSNLQEKSENSTGKSNSETTNEEQYTRSSSSEETEKEPDFFAKHLIIYKAFYFLFYGAVGSLFPYLAVFYKQLYLSAQQVGFLIGVRPFIQMGTAPLWGALADTYNVKKIILLMSLAAWLGTNYSISFVRIPPSIACAVNDSIVRIPPPGRIVTTNQNNANNLNDTTLKNSNEEQMGARRASYQLIKNRPTQKYNDTLLDTGRFITRRTTESGGKKANVVGTTNFFYYHRNRRSDKLVTSIRTEISSDTKPNVTTVNSNIPEVQRLLAADELEEEFDSFNTDGDYPWPLGK